MGGTLLTTRGSGFETLSQDRLSDSSLNIQSTNECWFGNEISITAEFISNETVTYLSAKKKPLTYHDQF